MGQGWCFAGCSANHKAIAPLVNQVIGQLLQAGEINLPLIIKGRDNRRQKVCIC